MARRFMALLLTLAVLGSLLCTAALAVDAEDGTAAPEHEWFSSGGERGEYYISTAAEMADLAKIVNSGYAFKNETISLTEDIDLTGIDWIPIGGDTEKVSLDDEVTDQDTLTQAIKEHWIIYDEDGNSYSGSTGEYSQLGKGDLPYSEDASYYYVKSGLFSGTFDGCGHTISGLRVDTDLGYAGLFGKVDGALKNFTVSGSVTYTGENGDYIGGVAGMLAEGGTISRVTSDVAVTAKNGYNVGGIAGFVGTPLSVDSATNTVVTMCINNGTVTGYNKVGGIAGENAGIVELCVNTGSIRCLKPSGNAGCGGIVGRNGCNNAALEAGTIRNCYNTGTFTGVKWLGGIAGLNNAKSSVSNCYSIVGIMWNSSAATYQNPVIGKNESYLGGNNYALSGLYYSYAGTTEETGIWVSSDELSALAEVLGSAYRTSPTGGYPELLWRLDSSSVTFHITGGAEEYTIQVVDSIGIPVAPEADGSYLFVDGETYTYTVTAAGYKTASGDLAVTDDKTVNITLAEAVGPVVTLDNKTGTVTPAMVSGIVSGLDYERGERTFHVDCDLACVVAYTTDGGGSYTQLTAAASAGGGYDFTIDLTADTEIAIALKGDLNLNGTADTVDAFQIQRFVVGIISLTPLQTLAADVNEDGKPDTIDTFQLQRSVVGLTTFNW